jgi:hypothetical protein
MKRLLCTFLLATTAAHGDFNICTDKMPAEVAAEIIVDLHDRAKQDGSDRFRNINARNFRENLLNGTLTNKECRDLQSCAADKLQFIKAFREYDKNFDDFIIVRSIITMLEKQKEMVQRHLRPTQIQFENLIKTECRFYWAMKEFSDKYKNLIK